MSDFLIGGPICPICKQRGGFGHVCNNFPKLPEADPKCPRCGSGTVFGQCCTPDYVSRESLEREVSKLRAECAELREQKWMLAGGNDQLGEENAKLRSDYEALRLENCELRCGDILAAEERGARSAFEMVAEEKTAQKPEWSNEAPRRIVRECTVNAYMTEWRNRARIK